MVDPKPSKVSRINGSRADKINNQIQFSFMTDNGDKILSFDPEMLSQLALSALHAKTIWNQNAQTDPPETEIVEFFHCNRWEVRVSPDKKFVMMGFRHTSGAWLRVQIPMDGVPVIRETLETIEGRNQASVSLLASRNPKN